LTLIIPNNNPVKGVGFYPIYLNFLSKLKLAVEDVLMQPQGPQQHGLEECIWYCGNF